MASGESVERDEGGRKRDLGVMTDACLEGALSPSKLLPFLLSVYCVW